MRTSPRQSSSDLVEREVERERHEHQLHRDARSGMSFEDDFRTKDARDNPAAANLKRPAGR